MTTLTTVAPKTKCCSYSRKIRFVTTRLEFSSVLYMKIITIQHIKAERGAVPAEENNNDQHRMQSFQEDEFYRNPLDTITRNWMEDQTVIRTKRDLLPKGYARGRGYWFLEESVAPVARLAAEEVDVAGNQKGSLSRSSRTKSLPSEESLYGLKQAPRALDSGLNYQHLSTLIIARLAFDTRKRALRRDTVPRTEYQLADMFTKALPSPS
ncbi:hypothetical protein Tco_1039841 [Tanacetum coccineum]